MKLSVIIPVYNEAETIGELLAQVMSVPLDLEVIVVDDHSTDGTLQELERFDGRVRVITHPRNQGKGAAVRTGLAHVTGEAVIIQDADCEYEPQEYPLLLRRMISTGAQAVYGSRFHGGFAGMSLSFRLGNRLLTGLTNLLFGSRLTDMETCYKLIRTEALRSLGLRCDRFEFEPEVTALLLKKGIQIEEIPISYRARSSHSGKKLKWIDGIHALRCLIRHRLRT